MKRPVFIERVRDTWMVFYVERNKGQRYSAAQFACDGTSHDQVVDWIRAQSKIELVTEEEKNNFRWMQDRKGYND